MLKKIAFVAMMLVLPLGVMAQAKFGHLNSQEVITAMPEYTKANSDLETLAKTYQEEMQRTQAEFNKKYEEYVQQVDSLPKNIAERRQKELEEMAQRQQQFQQDAQQSLQKAQQEAFQPILKKLNDAIDAVGKADGFLYIFDLANTPVAFVGAASVDVTAKVKTQLGIK